ncbi:hypothetical protein M3Y99_01255800 [Aphelenchoides fujianensis]|nr:hypothetical protein M3Y99_01255800 [Aphelenchoides fujianensis]
MPTPEFCGTKQEPAMLEEVQKRKPKMRMDVRRALMFQALETNSGRNWPAPGPDFFRERAALRRRTLRMFFCARSFSTAFFRISEKSRMPIEGAIPIIGMGVSTMMSSESFKLTLNANHLRLESLLFLLRLGQTDISRLELAVCVANSSRISFDRLQKMAIILSAVKNLRNLKNVNVSISHGTRAAAWMIHLLREFLPSSIFEFQSSCQDDFLVLALKPPARSVERVHFTRNTMKYLGPLFQSRARVILLNKCVAEMTAHGPFELNEQVERVVVTIYNRPQAYYPFDAIANPSPYEQKEREFCTAVQNLCTLNDRFVLHVWLVKHFYRDFLGGRDQFYEVLSSSLVCSRRVAETAKCGGHPNVQITVEIELPYPMKKPHDYEQMRAAAAEFFGANPNFTRQFEPFDAQLVTKLGNGPVQLVDVWNCQLDEIPLDVVFTRIVSLW